MNYKIFTKLRFLTLITISALILLSACGIYRKTDAREVSPNADERVKKNMEEGRGLQIFKKKNTGGTFQFASANAMWRASLEILDFVPLQNVDYGGGVIVTDWFSEGKDNDQVKISVRFLSNEIRVDGLQVDLYKKTCDSGNSNCVVDKINNNIGSEIKLAILKRASLIKKEGFEKNKKKSIK